MNLFKWEEAKKKLKDLVEYKDINNIVVSFSGGKDSTLLLELINQLGWKDRVNVVFCNTFMELNPTLDFVDIMKNQGWKIYETQPKKPLPIIYKEYGKPFHSKYTSEMIYRLQKHNFDFKNDTYKPYEDLIIKYQNCEGALKWLCGKNITLNCPKWVKKFLSEEGDNIKIANKCCEFVKKRPVKQFLKDIKADLCLVGVRQDESLQRKAVYKSCYREKDDLKFFYPLLFLTEEEVWELIKLFNLELSECYTKWGLERTGCFCCPFGREWEMELELLKKYEPNKYIASMNLYGDVFKAYKKYK